MYYDYLRMYHCSLLWCMHSVGTHLSHHCINRTMTATIINLYFYKGLCEIYNIITELNHSLIKALFKFLLLTLTDIIDRVSTYAGNTRKKKK